MFVGSDWRGTDKWNKIEEEFAKIGCRVEHLPHTDGISSTILRDKLNNKNYVTLSSYGLLKRWFQ
jgi:glycerol-3-phosphate cytidylyltransferase